ncbi:hypothetical protein [Spongiactinospora sp. TRM90649]|uniref:hypothetical protein n=1 Tax=Spongiactinospora sp. TRM90649 TaxID=3031114 RepID=UPI0023F889E7|nr:hypothetical protein [Spongiactinospora sp. TRM90649]MDF5752869.1 hypothetical protein [Spongiactinospora sp. TRM90649]
MLKIVAAASAALGRELTDPEDLGGGRRTTVLRCRVPGEGSVVVKTYRDTPEGAGCFAAEAAGLTLGGPGPLLLAVDPSVPLIVMSDLGGAPSLADRLLGDSPGEARDAVLTWARAYGEIAVATAGRQGEFAEMTARFAGHGRPRPSVYARIKGITKLLPDVPPGLSGELATLAADAEGFPVFSPGDICPDNNLLTPSGLRVLDFEWAGFHSAFLDAAYTRMPFATCWCVFRMPETVAAEAEAAYRAEVVRIHPGLADDAVWDRGVRHAIATWTLDLTVALLERVREHDLPAHRTRQPVPTVRELLRHRWSGLLAELERTGDLPAVAETVRGLLAGTTGWQVDPLPFYPAFRA